MDWVSKPLCQAILSEIPWETESMTPCSGRLEHENQGACQIA